MGHRQTRAAGEIEGSVVNDFRAHSLIFGLSEIWSAESANARVNWC